MKKDIKVSVVQFEPKSFKEKKFNIEYMLEKIELESEGKDLIIFPELSLNNFFEMGPESRKQYWDYSELLDDSEGIENISDLAKKKGVHVIFGVSEKSDKTGLLHNSAILITPAKKRFVQRKIHLPGNEKFYYLPGKEINVFDTELGKIGLCICYDFFFPEVTRILAIKGAEIIVSISSVWKGGAKGGIGSGGEDLAINKELLFDLLPVVYASVNQVFIIQANGCGKLHVGEGFGDWERMGKSKIIDPFGNILAEAGNTEKVISAELKYDRLIKHRTGFSFLMDRMPDRYKDIFNADL